MKSDADLAHAALVGAAMKAIRQDRRMRASDVARAMGMPLRSYEHFEGGRGRITFDRIARFAEVTNSDALAILAVLPLESPEFALRCSDNKLMTILMIALSELNDELGNDSVFLEPGTLIGAFTRVAKDLKEHVAKRDLFAETWLEQNRTRLRGSRSLPELRLRRRTVE